MTPERLAEWAQIVGFPIALAALAYAAWQLRLSAKIARGQFLLELKGMVARHDDIYHKVTPEGPYAAGHSQPVTPEEWSRLVDYLGFFESCEFLIQNGSLTASTFKTLFGYRLRNLAKLDYVISMINDPDEDWHLTHSAMRRLGIDPKTGVPHE
jgi:hypothetical protein